MHICMPQVIKDVHSKQLEQSVRAEMRVQLAAQRYVERERGDRGGQGPGGQGPGGQGPGSSIFAEVPRQGPGPNFAIKMHQATSEIDDEICALLAVGTLRFLRGTWLVKVRVRVRARVSDRVRVSAWARVRVRVRARARVRARVRI